MAKQKEVMGEENPGKKGESIQKVKLEKNIIFFFFRVYFVDFSPWIPSFHII